MRTTNRSLAIATLAFLASVAPAVACFETDTTPRPWLWLTSTTTANVAIEGLVAQAGGINSGNYCAVALGHSGTLITAVSALSVVDDADPNGGPVPIGGLSFTTNATTTGEVALAEPGTTWQAFHSPVGFTIPAGTSVAPIFSVSFPASTTYQDLMEELQGDGLVAFDDATAGGNLAGSLEVEPILGASDLPYCYDDIPQPGEVCDGLSNMGCNVGDSCVDCSTCLPGNPANACKSSILKSIAYSERSQLKCWAAGAKVGLPADNMCIQDVNSASLLWMKYVPSCPQTLPPAPAVQGWIDSLGQDLALLLPLGTNAPPGSFKCTQQKFKAASFLAVGKAKCYSKAYRYNTAVDPLCLSKVDTKYAAKFAKAELPGLCDPANTGNATPVATRADQFVTDIVTNIPPP
jgi:hypothetical protein